MPHNIIATIAATITLFASTGAFAHASITASSIANGGNVDVAPTHFNVTFSGPVRLAEVTLTNSAGGPVPVAFQGPIAPAATFAVPLPQLAAGSYIIAFRATGTDGHAVSPQSSFTIGAATTAVPAPMPKMGGMDHSKMGGMAGMNHSGGSMTVTTSIIDGASLSTAPTSMRITFPHAMRLTSARLSVASGETIPVRLPTETTATTTADITFPRLDPDSYSLTWGADAGDHKMSGTVRFAVR
jgi:methionine-rich copper-binding protein CopC